MRSLRKYLSERLRFSNDFPLGVSNEIVQKSAKITVHSGVALVLLVLVLLVKEQEYIWRKIARNFR